VGTWGGELFLKNIFEKDYKSKLLAFFKMKKILCDIANSLIIGILFYMPESYGKITD